MSYIPLSVVNDAIGSETVGFFKLTQTRDQILFDKGELVAALDSFGVPASTSESLLELIEKVAGLSVNFRIALAEVFNQVGTDATDDAVATALMAVLTPAGLVELFGALSSSPFSSSGALWLTTKWNAVMTSNTTPAGFVTSASSENTGYEAWKAFDNSNAAETNSWLTATGQTNGWVQYEDQTTGVVVGEYRITSRNAASGGSEAPKVWTFKGSNDGSSWTTLDTRSSVTGWGQNETRKFYFMNTTTYRFYRLDVTENNGSVNFVAVGELELREAISGVQTF